MTKARRRNILYVYADGSRWCWAVIASNGKLLALSPAQGFGRRSRAVEATKRLFSMTPVFTSPPSIPHQANDLRMDLASLFAPISAPSSPKKGSVSTQKEPVLDMKKPGSVSESRAGHCPYCRFRTDFSWALRAHVKACKARLGRAAQQKKLEEEKNGA